MSSLISKIRRFFKRNRGESDNGKAEPKRVKYITTPATIKFSPKQVKQKRVQRQYYIYKELLDVTEDRNYEFKAGGMLLQRHTLIPMIQKYGSAFLNSEGGVLIGGVSDCGEVTGIYCSIKQEVEIESTVKSEFEKFRPYVTPDMYNVQFLQVKGRDHSLLHNVKIVEIHVYKGEDEHLYETSNHQVFIRRDGGVQGPLRPLAIKDVVEQKYQKVLKIRQEKEAARAKLKENDEKISKENNEGNNRQKIEPQNKGTNNSQDVVVTYSRGPDKGNDVKGAFVKETNGRNLPQYIGTARDHAKINQPDFEGDNKRGVKRKVEVIDLENDDTRINSNPSSKTNKCTSYQPVKIQRMNFASTARRFFRLDNR